MLLTKCLIIFVMYYESCMGNLLSVIIKSRLKVAIKCMSKSISGKSLLTVVRLQGTYQWHLKRIVPFP